MVIQKTLAGSEASGSISDSCVVWQSMIMKEF